MRLQSAKASVLFFNHAALAALAAHAGHVALSPMSPVPGTMLPVPLTLSTTLALPGTPGTPPSNHPSTATGKSLRRTYYFQWFFNSLKHSIYTQRFSDNVCLAPAIRILHFVFSGGKLWQRSVGDISVRAEKRVAKSVMVQEVCNGTIASTRHDAPRFHPD